MKKKSILNKMILIMLMLVGFAYADNQKISELDMEVQTEENIKEKIVDSDQLTKKELLEEIKSLEIEIEGLKEEIKSMKEKLNYIK